MSIRGRASCLLLLTAILLVATAGTGICTELVQHNVSMAKPAMSLFAHTQKGLPAIATVVFAFYAFMSLVLHMLTDQQYHKWGVKLVISFMMWSGALGGSIHSAFLGGANKNTDSKQQIQRVMMNTYPGNGAIESATKVNSATNFEVLASMFDNADESLASNTSENVAMVQTIADSVNYTRWALDMTSTMSSDTHSSTGALGWISDLFAFTPSALSGGDTPSNSVKDNAPQKELYQSIANINHDDTGLLGTSALFIYSTIASVSGDIQARYDSRQMLEASKGDEATGGANTASSLSNGSVDNLFAEANITSASNSSNPVTVVTMATYPGGVQEYGRHALLAISNEDHNYHAGTIPAEQITRVLNSSGQTAGSIDPSYVTGLPSPTSSVPGTLFDHAKQAGFDGTKEGVYPQFFLRTHGELQASECNSNSTSSGLRPGESNSGGSSIFNPMSNLPSSPIPAMTQQIQGAAMNFLSLNSFTNRTGGTLMNSLTNTILGSVNRIGVSVALQGTNAMFGKLNGYTPSFSNFGQSGAHSSITSQYDQLIADSANNGMSHATNCLQNGRRMYGIASAVSQTSGENDATWHRYLEPSSGSQGLAAESSSTLSWNVANDNISSDALAANLSAHQENTASVVDLIGHVIGYISSVGVGGGGSTSMNTKLPGGGQETSQHKPDQKLKVAEEKSKSQGKKTWAERAWDATKAAAGALGDAFVIVFNFLLKLEILLLAGLPFIALLTQVAIVTTVAIISHGLGIAMIPIWLVMNFGKHVTSSSAGDDAHSGMALFPFMTIAVTVAALGAEVAAATVCQGEVNYYLTHIVPIFFAQTNAVFHAIGLATGFSVPFDTVFKPMVEATKPFGVCAAAVVGPALIARMLVAGAISPHGSASAVQAISSSSSEGGIQEVGKSVGKVATAAAML